MENPPTADETDTSDEDDEPLYTYSWRRFVVVVTALLTLPAWGPWVKEHIATTQLLIAIPFAVIFVISLAYMSFAFPTKSIRYPKKRKK